MGIGLDIGIVVGVLILALVVLYNGLISKRNRVQNAAAQIDVQLKRRYDLIPNLVETVKGYMKYEKGVLTDVTRLRSSLVSGSMQDKAQANNQLSTALKTLFAVAENYPQLKASENFIDLQEQITATEDKIAFVRTSYNDYVLDFNNAIQEFPSNIVANTFGFKQHDFFTAPEDEKEVPKANFDDVNAPAPKAAPPPSRGKGRPKPPAAAPTAAPSPKKG